MSADDEARRVARWQGAYRGQRQCSLCRSPTLPVQFATLANQRGELARDRRGLACCLTRGTVPTRWSLDARVSHWPVPGVLAEG
jgi:hypothetical protein